MRHLLIGAEYPPAPGGGIGTYMVRVCELLSRAGEEVHVITLQAPGAPDHEVLEDGHLTIHRINVTPGTAEDQAIYASYYPWLFSKRAAELAERLIEQHAIDVVEGSEFEAPLYVLQHRRALGLGPARKPPFLVHMHGATEVVFSYGAFDPGGYYNRLAQNLESFTIRHADQILFPSQHYADMGTERFRLDPARVAVIPYPVDITPPLDRSTESWSDGSVLFAGRLEARKGIAEWVDAAVALADDHPGLRFEFAGSHGLSNEWRPKENPLMARIPDRVSDRFIFHGQKTAVELRRLRASAKIAVVPSRWDNFPYVCLEAMAAGLPLLGTITSGAGELVRDGVDGWLSPACTATDLYNTATRALGCSAGDLAEMGASARARLMAICDKHAVLRRQRDLRETMAARKAAEGAGVIVNGAPLATVADAPPVTPRAANSFATSRLHMASHTADAFLLTGPNDAVSPSFTEQACQILANRPDIGMVGGWIRDPDGVLLFADPDVPSQLLDDGMDGPILVRGAVLDQLTQVLDSDPPELARWTAVMQAMIQGWRCVNLQECLTQRTRTHIPNDYVTHTTLQREVHRRFPVQVAAHAPTLIAWSSSPSAVLRESHEHSVQTYAMMLRRVRRALWPLLRLKARDKIMHEVKALRRRLTRSN